MPRAGDGGWSFARTGWGIAADPSRLAACTADDETGERTWPEVLTRARAQALRVYDAAYLALAPRGLPPATLEDELKAGALGLGVAEKSALNSGDGCAR